MTDRFNLLLDPIFSTATKAGNVSLTLPEVMERLGNDGVLSFSALQPHQSHAWHAFTVQLAAILLHGHREKSPAQDAETWRKWMHKATDGDDAWCLVSDLDAPAFLQPPVPEKKLKGWKGPRFAPDEIDILITAKNHDVKTKRIASPAPEHWVYALLNLQTMQGFLGAGNYGIARMNGGFSNRPGVGIADGLSFGARFAGDVSALLGSRNEIVKAFEYPAQGGHALLWTLPWNGNKPLNLSECDPFFIEVCRRIRLVHSSGRLEAWGTSSKAVRVSSEKGMTGDPWTPLKKEAALTVGGGGFHYELLSDLLFGSTDVTPNMLLNDRMRRSDPQLVAWALVRGQGKTEGLHERVVALSGRAREMLDQPELRRAMGAQARERIEAVEVVRRKVLHPALCALLQGGPSNLDFRDDRTRRWTDALDDDADAEFFRHLFETYQSPAETGIDAWKRLLLQKAEAQLDAAVHRAPVPAQRRYRAESMARGLFHGAARKHLNLIDTPEEPDVVTP